VVLAAGPNGALGAGAAVVLVAALLMFIRSAFRLLDELERRDEDVATRHGRDGPPKTSSGRRP
jgi:hypothetical protein